MKQIFDFQARSQGVWGGLGPPRNALAHCMGESHESGIQGGMGNCVKGTFCHVLFFLVSVKNGYPCKIFTPLPLGNLVILRDGSFSFLKANIYYWYISVYVLLIFTQILLWIVGIERDPSPNWGDHWRDWQQGSSRLRERTERGPWTHAWRIWSQHHPESRWGWEHFASQGMCIIVVVRAYLYNMHFLLRRDVALIIFGEMQFLLISEIGQPLRCEWFGV